MPGHCEQPGADGPSLGVEALRRAPGAQQHFLDDVVGQLRVAGGMQAERAQRRPVLGLGCVDELFARRHVFCHGCGPPSGSMP